MTIRLNIRNLLILIAALALIGGLIAETPRGLGHSLAVALGFGGAADVGTNASAATPVVSAGGKSLRDAAPPEKESVHLLPFTAGREARVIVVGDHDSDLDIAVYDERGRLVAQDVGRGDTCAASWTPARPGNFTVKVINRGVVYNDYTLFSN